MKLTTQPPYLPYLERRSAHTEEDGVLARVGPHAFLP